MVKNVEDTYRRLTPYLRTESIDHGGECSMQTSGLRESVQVSKMSQFMTESLSGIPEALPNMKITLSGD